MYSDSFVDKAMSVFIVINQTIGKCVNLIMYPVIDRTYPTLSAFYLHHDTAKYAPE